MHTIYFLIYIKLYGTLGGEVNFTSLKMLSKEWYMYFLQHGIKPIIATKLFFFLFNKKLKQLNSDINSKMRPRTLTNTCMFHIGVAGQRGHLPGGAINFFW